MQHQTILVVEDSLKLRPLIVHILERAGYLVLVADGAEQAQEIVRSADSPIHLVITDLILPGASGIELGRRLKDQAPGLGILYMSGLDMPPGDDVEFIAKPFTPEQLLDKVRQFLV